MTLARRTKTRPPKKNTDFSARSQDFVSYHLQPKMMNERDSISGLPHKVVLLKRPSGNSFRQGSIQGP